MVEIDDRPDENYDPEQLQKGIEAEMEHEETIRKIIELAKNPSEEIIRQISEMIAKDHLDEMSDYYDKLETIEPEHGDDVQKIADGTEEQI